MSAVHTIPWHYRAAVRTPLPRQRTVRMLCGLLLCAALSACGATIPRVPAQGEVAGYRIDTSVDSPLAKYYVESYLRGERRNPEWDGQLDRLHAQSGPLPTAVELQKVSGEYSVDVAALYFAQRVLQMPENRQWQQEFGQELERGQQDAAADVSEVRERGYRVVFIPGWLYLSKPWTGADFARQRALLSRQGVDNHLIELHDNGTIEDNAAIIARELQPLLRDGKPVILVSGSKGSPEVAYALGHLMPPEQTRRVRAWLNICGAIQGSPLADTYTTWPSRLIAEVYFRAKGWGGLKALESLRTRRSLERSDRISIPPHILVVNYIGVPVSGTIIDKEFAKRFTYSQLRSHGPNDGLVLVPDEIAPGGVTITEIGRGHFLSEPDVDVRTAALLRTLGRRLESGTPSQLAVPEAAPDVPAGSTACLPPGSC